MEEDGSEGTRYGARIADGDGEESVVGLRRVGVVGIRRIRVLQQRRQRRQKRENVVIRGGGSGSNSQQQQQQRKFCCTGISHNNIKSSSRNQSNGDQLVGFVAAVVGVLGGGLSKSKASYRATEGKGTASKIDRNAGRIEDPVAPSSFREKFCRRHL